MNLAINILLIVLVILAIISIGVGIYGSVMQERRSRTLARLYSDDIEAMRGEFEASKHRQEQEQEKRNLRQQSIKHLKRQTH